MSRRNPVVVPLTQKGRVVGHMGFPPGTTQAKIDEDIARENELLKSYFDRGSTEVAVRFRSYGWGRVMVIKQVGPPPWPWPKAKLWLPKRKEGHRSAGAMVGWRSTAYELIGTTMPRWTPDAKEPQPEAGAPECSS